MAHLQAVKQLEALAQNESEHNFIRAAILRRLADEHPGVLDATLSSPAIKVLPPEELVRGISALLKNARVAISDKSSADSADKKILREIIEKALRVLATHAAERKAEVAAELLNFVIGPAALHQISRTAAALAAKIEPLTGKGLNPKGI